MADCVDATITIGGPVPADRLQDLIDAIQCERIGPDWDERFRDQEDLLGFLKDGATGVTFYGRQVPGGEFEDLQSFCVQVGLTYVLTYDGYGCSWGPARRICRPGDSGDGDTCPLTADNGAACIDGQDIRRLGLTSVAAIIERLELFDRAHVPPLELTR